MPDRRKAITLTILHGICREFSTMCSTRYEVQLFQAVCLVYFFRAFQPSEVPPSSCFSPWDKALRWEDCVLQDDQVSFKLRMSKTD